MGVWNIFFSLTVIHYQLCALQWPPWMVLSDQLWSSFSPSVVICSAANYFVSFLAFCLQGGWPFLLYPVSHWLVSFVNQHNVFSFGSIMKFLILSWGKTLDLIVEQKKLKYLEAQWGPKKFRGLILPFFSNFLDYSLIRLWLWRAISQKLVFADW